MLAFRFSVNHCLPSDICAEDPRAPGTCWSFADGCLKQDAPTNAEATLSGSVIQSRNAVTMPLRAAGRDKRVNERVIMS
jgi:hypothetical protein